MAVKRSVVAGILMIIASVICLMVGRMLFIVAEGYHVRFLGLLLFPIEFAFALTSGILALIRKVFSITVVCMLFTIAVDIVVTLDGGAGVGIPILVLAIVGIIFTLKSEREFK